MLRGAIGRVLSLADDPADEDDLRLRKRIGVAAGYLTIVAPFTMPILAQGHPVAIVVGVSLAVFSVLNLLVLRQTRRFERYVVALVTSGTIFVPIATWLSGGLTLTSSGLVWGFLVPAYALLALGPRTGPRWYAAFIAVVVAALVLELALPRPTGEVPYEVRLIGSVANTIAPLSIVFLMLLYSDRRRREAEARSEALLTNAIPAAIARRLKRGETRIADIYPETTVLFADLAGFTPWARVTDPSRVVAALDGLFSRFDRVLATGGHGEDQDDRRRLHGRVRCAGAARRPCRDGAARRARDARFGGGVAARARTCRWRSGSASRAGRLPAA